MSRQPLSKIGAHAFLEDGIEVAGNRLYESQSILINSVRFEKELSEMSYSEAIEAFDYIAAVLSQSPVGAGWSDVQYSDRIIASTFEGAIWTVNIGFRDKPTALAFANHPRVVSDCVLNTQPRKGKRTGCPFEVKLWSPNPKLLMKLMDRQTAIAA